MMRRENKLDKAAHIQNEKEPRRTPFFMFNIQSKFKSL